MRKILPIVIAIGIFLSFLIQPLTTFALSTISVSSNTNSNTNISVLSNGATTTIINGTKRVQTWFDEEDEEENRIQPTVTPRITRTIIKPSPTLTPVKSGPTSKPIQRVVASPTPTRKPTPTKSQPTKVSTPTPIKSEPTIKPAQSSTNQKQTYIIQAINNYRKSQGLSAVKTDTYTCNFARTRAKEISSSFDHAGFRNRINNKSLPYPGYSMVTENIAMTSDYKKVVTMWINSAGHAANMRKDTPYVCVEDYGNYYAYEGWRP